MDKFVINGGNKLCGEVTVSGAKNAAVAIIPATLLVKGKCRLENLPKISDVTTICDTLKRLGASVTYNGDGSVVIDTTDVNSHVADYDMVRKMRASYYLLGALLGRFSKARVALPGGCDFGSRPIDQHTKGFEALGAHVSLDHGTVVAEAKRLRGSAIYLDTVSVGATVNIMLAAVLAEGTTVIDSAAKEPHIVDLANFLNAMGANIKGAGTDVIKITGVKSLKGGSYSIIPDQIEAGTFMIAAAAVGGDVLVKNIIPRHMESLSAKLTETGVTIEEYDDSIRVKSIGRLKAVNVKTLPYPGFPTDLQPQISALLTTANGTSVVTEGVWNNRFQYVDELIRMGANIKVDGRTAVITGVECLSGAPIRATDLRAGAALTIAGLMANGTTEIYSLSHIDRGYENFDKKLRGLGADIKRVSQ